MLCIKLFASFSFILSAFTVCAQDLYQIQNRWKPNEFIQVEQSTPASTPIEPGWLSAQWFLESVPDGYYMLKNNWRNQYLHIQNGPLECGAVQPGWWSAQWALEPVEGTSFVRIRNRWKPEIALSNQNGALEAGKIDLGWWSAQWQTVVVSHVAPAAQQREVVATQHAVQETRPAATTQVVSANVISARNSANPSAFTTEHGGTIQQISVRYTDQITFPGTVAVGTRVYFFPQEVIVDTQGLSFDPKNPPIGGQSFTVSEINPKVKLDRPMPMMRNRNNDYIGFVVEVY